MFGKSIIRPPAPPARRPVDVPSLPWRTLAFALLATVGAGYAVARHYLRPPPPPAVREIPAPDLQPLPPG